jgi:hypothetical protein
MMTQVKAAKKPTPRKRPYNEGPMLDQGNKPHCVGFGTRGIIQAAPLMVKPGVGPDGSMLYDMAQERDEWEGKNYDGSSVNGGMKAGRDAGFFESYAWFNTQEQLVDWTNGGYGTVAVGTYWYPAMDNVDKDGYIIEPPNLASPVGGHFYRVNWWDKVKQAYLIINTWGFKWGMLGKKGELTGTAYMRPQLAERLFFKEQGEVAAPVEIRLKPVRV